MPSLLPRRYRRRPFYWGTAMLLWDIWRRLPPKQRKIVLAQMRRHGTRVARHALHSRKKR